MRVGWVRGAWSGIRVPRCSQPGVVSKGFRGHMARADGCVQDAAGDSFEVDGYFRDRTVQSWIGMSEQVVRHTANSRHDKHRRYTLICRHRLDRAWECYTEPLQASSAAHSIVSLIQTFTSFSTRHLADLVLNVRVTSTLAPVGSLSIVRTPL